MKAHEGGFSLIEILVVIGAVGILIGIAIPAYDGYREKAKIAEAQHDLKKIERAIITLASDTGEWPNHFEVGKACPGCGSNEIWDLTAATVGLLADDTGTPYPNWNGPYIPEIPKDPWGMDYFMDTDYIIDGDNKNVVIGSFGPDREGKTTYDSNNIIIRLPCRISAGADRCK